jgi:hypothetical protein
MASEEQRAPCFLRSAEDASNAIIEDFAVCLGIDIDLDRDLFWIPRLGLGPLLPYPWIACVQVDDEDEDLFYYNQVTQQTTFMHPYHEVLLQMAQASQTQRVSHVLTLHCEAEPTASSAKVSVTNLAGSTVADVLVQDRDETRLEAVLEEVLGCVCLPNHTVPRFVLADGALIGHGSTGCTVAQIFGVVTRL